jgi:subtilisin family serine protease
MSRATAAIGGPLSPLDRDNGRREHRAARRAAKLAAAAALVVLLAAPLALGSRAEAPIYWANSGTSTIGRAGLDRSGADQSLISAGKPRGVALDGAHVDWSWLPGGTCDTGGCPSFLGRASAPERGRKFVPGELLVRFRSGVGARAQSSVLGALDATTKRRLPLPGLQLVRIGGRESVPQAVASFERRPQVRYAEPNFIYRIEATPNDPRFGELWGLDNSGQSVNGTTGTPDADIDAPEAWDTTTGSSAVTVAVVDTGVDYDHPDLSPNIRTNPGESGHGKESNGVDDDGNGYVDDWRGWDFIDSDNDPRDLHHHGTHVAGTIGARGDDGGGVVGVNWQVGLMPVRVLNADGFGTNAGVTAGFAYAGANGAKVVNASLGGSDYSQAMSDAITGAPNTLFVVSAGNDATNNDANPQYPCNYTASNIVCVAATTQSDGLAGFSDYGAGSVDLGAPGKNVLSAYPENQFSFLNGTSMASPHVAGAAALLWAQEPGISPGVVKSKLLSSVDPLPALAGKTVSGGRLNVYRALGGSPPFPPNTTSGEPEVPVNATTAGDQGEPAIAADPGGGFTVAWESYGQDGSGSGVYARHFPTSGDPTGEIAVNTTTAYSQRQPVIAADDSGGFTIAWATYDEHEECLEVSPDWWWCWTVYTSHGVYARSFEADGTPLSEDEIPVNTTAGESPAIAADPGGGFTVAWTSDGQDGSGYGVFARRFDAAGAPLSGEIPVNTTTAGSQFDPAIAADGSGGFTVAWRSNGQDGSGDGVFARRFDAAGEPLSGEIPVNTTTAGLQYGPTIAPAGSGAFTVAWTSGSNDTDWVVFARRFDAAGAPLSGEIQVDTTTAGAQFDPAIAPAGSGAFTVAWISDGQDGSGYGVFARRFDAAGAPLSGEIPVNVTTAGHQRDPAIAPAGSGGFTVAWTSWYQDGSGSGVYARRFVDAPDTQIDSGPAGPTNDPTPTFAFSSEQGTSFQCRIDTAAWAGCTSPYESASLADGPHSFEVRATDAAANTDPTPASRPFTVDTVPPSLSILSGPTGPTNDPTPSFGFSAEAGSSLQCSIDTGSASFGACSGASTHSPSGPLADGPYTFRARATDAAGNSSTETRSFSVDTVPPDTLISGPSGPTNDSTPTFTFSSSEAGASFECQLDVGGFSVCSSPHTTSPLTDGSHTFEVRAIDAAGNPDSIAASRSFTLDTVPPDTAIDSGPLGPSNDPTPTFTFSSNEQDGGFACRMDSGGYSPCSSPVTYVLTDGSHTFEVRAIDAAGNPDSTAASRSFTLDTVPPDTTIDSGPTGPNDNTPTFAFSSEQGASFECRLDGGGHAACSSPFTSGPLSDGPHSFEVWATDAAANADPSPASASFTVDATPPDTTIDSGPTGPTNDATPTFAFSSEQGTSFACRLDDGGFWPCSSPLTAGPLSDGPHSFEVRAIDQDDNPDPTPASRSFTLDTVAPDTMIDSGPAGPTNDNTPTFGFSSDEVGSSFECRLDGGAFGACSDGSSHTPAALPDGPHSFVVRATDAAQNVDATPASRSFTVDTAPPVTAIDSGPSGPTNDATPTFGFSSGEGGSSFQCRIDNDAFGACSGPGQLHTPAALPDGPHSFEVRATDAVGNADATSATRSFMVDTTAPSTEIRSGPARRTWRTRAVFRFAMIDLSGDSGRFECRLDRRRFAPCASPKTYRKLKRRKHGFEVRAIDRAGNADPTPASRAWTVRRKR